jgi:hypothetical protein
MLSERERRALENIERELTSDDPRFAAFLRRGVPSRSAWLRARRQLVRPRSLVVFGVVVMLAAAFLGLDETFMQGLLLAAAGVAWWLWVAYGPPTDAPAPRRPRE